MNFTRAVQEAIRNMVEFFVNDPIGFLFGTTVMAGAIIGFVMFIRETRHLGRDVERLGEKLMEDTAGRELILSFLFKEDYENLVQASLQVQEAWSAIEVRLQHRNNLIPSLVDLAQHYASHERETFQKIAEARSSLGTATTPGAAAQAESVLTHSLSSLFAVVEAYPDLKADRSFRDLHEQIVESENAISDARDNYNKRVLDYNTLLKTSRLPAELGDFHSAEFFSDSPSGTRSVSSDNVEKRRDRGNENRT